jgi:hypothetical protein
MINSSTSDFGSAAVEQTEIRGANLGLGDGLMFRRSLVAFGVPPG